MLNEIAAPYEVILVNSEGPSHYISYGLLGTIITPYVNYISLKPNFFTFFEVFTLVHIKLEIRR